MRADVAAGVTGSLVAALALSYLVLPGSFVPEASQQASGPEHPGGGVQVVVAAARAGDPLDQPPGAVSAPLVPRAERRPVAQAEAQARKELAPRPAKKTRRSASDSALDHVSAAYLPAGVSLVRNAGPRESGSRQARATVGGATVQLTVSTVEEDGRTRTVSVLEGSGPGKGPPLRSVETLDGLPCPDAEGVVDVRAAVQVGLGEEQDGLARGQAGDTVNRTEARVHARVDSEANLVEAWGELSATRDGASALGTVPLGEGDRLPEVVATEELPQDPQRRRAVEDGLTAARALAAGTLAAAQELWAGGGCLAVRADVPRVVDAGGDVEIAPTVIALDDGSEVDADLELSLDGPGTLTRRDDGTHLFTAAPRRGRTATVRISATSARGRVEHGFQIATPRPDLRVDAVFKSVRVTGTKCGGPTGRWRWTLASSTGSTVGALVFRLSADLAGTYAGQRTFATAVGNVTVGEGGAVRYLPRRERLVLDDREGDRIEVPVRQGAFCD